MSGAVTITDAAAERVYELMLEEQNLQLNLRVYIVGGGCSGYKYVFTFDDIINDEEDTVFVKELSLKDDKNATVRVVINFASLQFLRGSEIDYARTIEGEQFIIRNPHAQTTCGCGSSFTVKEDEEENEQSH